jgi:hypothetical protein
MLGIAGLAVALAPPGTANAGLLTGVLSTAPASYCDPDVAQYFGHWGDSAWYRPVPGGTFEDAHGWALAGGAKVVTGNEPWRVKGSADSRSLYLPAGATATSPTTCFDVGDWHARFFVRNAGSGGTLEVDILVRSLVGGVLAVFDGGYVKADGTWDPSPKIGALATNVGGLLGTRAVSFRLRAAGSGAAFQVDDVFLDPFRSR